MPNLPEFVYLVTLESEWPVSAIAHDHPSAPERVAKEAARRTSRDNPRSRARIWRVPVANAVEMEVLPGQVIEPSLIERWTNA